MKVKYFDIFGLRGKIKMSVNPPQCIVDADFCISLLSLHLIALIVSTMMC